MTSTNKKLLCEEVPGKNEFSMECCTDESVSVHDKSVVTVKIEMADQDREKLTDEGEQNGESQPSEVEIQLRTQIKLRPRKIKAIVEDVNEATLDEEPRKRVRRKKIVNPERINTEVEMYECYVCCKEFKTESVLKKHLLKHKKEDEADEKCVRKKKKSNREQSPNEKVTYECHICNENFKNVSIMKKHLSKHKIEDYFCTYSAEKSSSENNEKVFTCKICKQVINEQSLKEHMKLHVEENQYSCHICHLKFPMNFSLRKHMGMHNRKTKFLSCSLCTLTFSDHSALATHFRIHTGDAPYVCEVCEKKFIRPNALKDHMRTHTGEKPYTCEICKTSFTLNTNYNKHMRIHTDMKQFQCEVCFVSFPRKDYLKRHMYKHTQEKPYPCDLCSFKCVEKANLKKHMKVHNKYNDMNSIHPIVEIKILNEEVTL